MHSKISSDNPTQSTINTISSTLLQVDQAWTKAGLPKDENYPLSGILYDLKSIPGAELSEAINLLFDQMEKLSSFYQKIAKDPKYKTFLPPLYSVTLKMNELYSKLNEATKEKLTLAEIHLRSIQFLKLANFL